MAVWEDGAVLVAVDPFRPGDGMRAGHVGPELVKAALAHLDADGFFAKPEAFDVPVDAWYFRISAARGGEVHSHFSVLRADSPKWLADTKRELDALKPASTVPLREVAVGGDYRGYSTADRWRARWMRQSGGV
jgi:hypothetical protein